MTLFSISSQRRFALFLLVLVALASLSVAMGISDIDFGSFTSSLMVYLFIIWLLFRRDIGYMRTLSDILWGQWEACAVSNQQKVQLLDVASSELIMKEIDKTARFAVFIDGKKCRSTLAYCSYRDFKKRGVPCKHMYRLASELGLIELPDPVFEN